ncbi:hypothetical protein OH460_08500 [Vibrio sp. Makdt]|uniref:hypothetical protein n=1 Tax=Vibrio sp. Makdt TaxID=2998828 RepID=UPI0022CD21D1|nr:hypothetical protein [Vibrio sp. Makdt]MDA0152340.1 hypothetical protein [Vibrio sp. Makdt]
MTKYKFKGALTRFSKLKVFDKTIVLLSFVSTPFAVYLMVLEYNSGSNLKATMFALLAVMIALGNLS